jgi:pilus assembly protein CpaE
MMSVVSDAEALRRSMLAGAKEYLTKPFTVDALVSSIRRVHGLGSKHKTDGAVVFSGRAGKVICVYSPKGGTGRSLLATNLAVLLHQECGRKVVIVDANLQFGDVGVLLNLRPTHTIADVIPRIAELDHEMMRGVLIPHSSGVKVLLAPERPELADLVAPDHLRSILRQLALMFDVVIVDTWSSLHDQVLGIMDVSDRVIIVTTPEIPAVKSTRMFFEVADALNYPPEKTMLVVNRANQEGAISVNDIQTSVRHRATTRLPCDDRAAAQAANVGVPLVLTSRRSLLTKALSQLAQHINSQLLAPEASLEQEPDVR